MAGRLIVFEGIDGSGKSTQFQLLCKRLEREGTPFQRLVFPQYEAPSSALIRMYLEGAFGQKPTDVNPYAASTFYAVDRYASFIKSWGADYRAGGLILADRYTTSNAVHQTPKLPREKWETFFRWLSEFEYQLLGLPAPDLVFYLDMPIEQAAKMIHSRTASNGGGASDIHEQDLSYLAACRETACQAAAFYGWKTIACVGSDRQLRTPEDLHDEIYAQAEIH